MKLHLIKNFKEICRLKLDSKFLNKIFKKAISFCGSKKQLAFKFNINWNTLYMYKTSRLYIPALTVEKLLKIIGKDLEFLEGYIKEIKFNNGSPFKVLSQKLEVDFNREEGGKIIAALLGDGYNKSKNSGAGYVNKNSLLRKEFLNNLTRLFKCIELRDYSKAYYGKILQLPSFFSYVFEKAGIPCGRKVLTNPGIPDWLLKSNKSEVISAYLQQIFDDEGHISAEKRMIDLPQSIDVTNGERVPKQLLDLVYLLSKIGIKSNVPYHIGNYKVKGKDRTYKRSRYVVTLSSYSELKKFKDKSNFLSKHKKEKLDKIIINPPLMQRKNKEIEKDVLKACRKIQSQKGRINSFVLANELNIGESYAQKLLKRLTKSGKLVKIKKEAILHKPNGDILKRTHAEFALRGGENVI